MRNIFVLVFAAIVLITFSVIAYAKTLEQSGDTVVKPVIWCGLQSDGTVTEIRATSTGQMKGA